MRAMLISRMTRRIQSAIVSGLSGNVMESIIHNKAVDPVDFMHGTLEKYKFVKKIANRNDKSCGSFFMCKKFMLTNCEGWNIVIFKYYNIEM